MFPEVSILEVVLLDAWVRNQWKSREKQDFATKILFHVLFQTGMLVPCQACVLGHCVLCGPAPTCARQCASWKFLFLEKSSLPAARTFVILAMPSGSPSLGPVENQRLLPRPATGQSTSYKTLLLVVTSPVTDESQDRASVNYELTLCDMLRMCVVMRMCADGCLVDVDGYVDMLPCMWIC